jgi:hypothetical protein
MGKPELVPGSPGSPGPAMRLVLRLLDIQLSPGVMEEQQRMELGPPVDGDND